MSDDNKKKSKTVTLKRAVTIKAIVTDKFKEYIRFEMNEAIRNTKSRMEQLQNAAKFATSNPGSKDNALLSQQMDAEKFHLEGSLKDLDARLKQVDTLKDGTEFMQGTIDGFVTISEGDNLYEKLGGMEIVVKDGIVQKINPVPNPGSVSVK